MAPVTTATQPGANHAPSSDSSQHACLSTWELLENILRYLDMRTLLRAQGVSRGFRDVIDGSLLLQRELFLVPTTFKEAIKTEEGENSSMRRLGPYLRSLTLSELRQSSRDEDPERPHMLNLALSIIKNADWAS